jgi:hypothetical protein
MRVRIGLAMAPREIEIEVEDPDSLASDIEQALAEGKDLVWVTDATGQRHGIAVGKVAFVEIEAGESKRVGFATE